MTDGGLLAGEEGESWEDPSAAVPAEEPAAVLGEPPPELLTLQRMESALVRAELQHPGIASREDVRRLRYVLGFARLTAFEPGAAERGGPGQRPEVDLGEGVAGLRDRVVRTLEGPLRRERDPGERLRGAAAALAQLVEPVAEARRAVLERHGSELSEQELDAEAGRRVLVNVAGGGGGAGFVYIGAWERLEQAGIVPGFVMAASIGSLIGLFRARRRDADWESYIALAKTLDRRLLFTVPLRARRFGLPGLLGLELAPTLAPVFVRDDGAPARIGDLEIPFEAAVAGVRRGSFERLPRRFRHENLSSHSAVPTGRRSPARMGPAIASRMWQVAAFFDRRIVRPILLGADDLTVELDAVHAAGFSAAIPGVLHYDVDPEDERNTQLLTELFAREELSALVDGGVASNVPAELAWRRVHAGRLGTRNAVYLAFDCFHPKWDPAHLWLQPITQAIALQMRRNAPFADWIVRFEPTLSPINLVPEPERLEQALDWGRAAMEEPIALLERMLEPVTWDAGGS